MGRIRTGKPILPIVSNLGTDGSQTDPRVVIFDEPARPCIVFNRTGNGNDILVKVNADDDTDFGGPSSDGPGHFGIGDGCAAEVSFRGILGIERISFTTGSGSDDLDNVKVVGWV